MQWALLWSSSQLVGKRIPMSFVPNTLADWWLTDDVISRIWVWKVFLEGVEHSRFDKNYWKYIIKIYDTHLYPKVKRYVVYTSLRINRSQHAFGFLGTFKELVNFSCLWCIMMFRWINKQPGMQKFWNWSSHYQDIYDWISPFNKSSDLWFILTHPSMGGNEYGKSGHLFEALNNVFQVQLFQGLVFTCWDIQLRFFLKWKGKTLLNNAFKTMTLWEFVGRLSFSL